MANPIKDTPILTGADAQRLSEIIKRHNENPDKYKVKPSDYERAIKAFQGILIKNGTPN